MNARYTAFSLALLATSVCATPQIIAHRGGTGDAPENTISAISLALANRAQAIWVTVQLSKDGIPVLYRPVDLGTLTNVTGKVSEYNAGELKKVDAAWQWRHMNKPVPVKDEETGIPALRDVLNKWPSTFFYIDIKSPDADPRVMSHALLSVLKQTHSLGRVRVYSTEDNYINALPPVIPRFVTRSETRTTLASVLLTHQCNLAYDESERWFGMELNRKVSIVESFTLGQGVSPGTLTWDEEAMNCFRSKGKARIILFGINNIDDYTRASSLGADGVLVDSPAEVLKWTKQASNTP